MTSSANQITTVIEPATKVADRLALAIDMNCLLPLLKQQWRSLADAGYQVKDCSVERVHPRSDGSFIVDYCLKLESEGTSIQQSVFGEISNGDPERHYRNVVLSLQKSRRNQISKKSPDHRVGLLMEPGLVMRFAGLDEKVHGLGLTLSGNELHRTLTGLPTQVPESDRVVDLLAHRLHRRAVVRLNGASRHSEPASIIAKFYKRSSTRSARTFEIMRFLRASSFGRSSCIRVPETIGHLADWSALVMVDIPGVAICDLPGDLQPAGMNLAGEALGRLHRVPLRVDARFSPEDELAILVKWTNLVASVWPDRRTLLRECMAKVSSLLNASNDFEPTCIHRDFHDKQVLVQKDLGHLIDFDTVCVGDPAQDTGNFLAHLELAELQGKVVDAQVCADDFLESYAKSGASAKRSNQEAYRASTLLRLACIYAFSSRWRHLFPRLLELA